MLRPARHRLKALIYAILGASLTTTVLTVALFIVAIALSATDSLPDGTPTLGGVGDGILIVLSLLLLTGGLTLFYSLIAFAIGITFLGAPAWYALHRLGLSGPKSLTATGAMLSVLGGVAIIPQSFPLTLLLAVPGGVAGWIIWKRGYKQA